MQLTIDTAAALSPKEVSILRILLGDEKAPEPAAEPAAQKAPAKRPSRAKKAAEKPKEDPEPDEAPEAPEDTTEDFDELMEQCMTAATEAMNNNDRPAVAKAVRAAGVSKVSAIENAAQAKKFLESLGSDA